MSEPIRIVAYLNQFFGGLGGEEAAAAPPSVVEGPVGPGMLLQQIVAESGTVAATIVCGDNYMAETPGAVGEVVRLIREQAPDLVVAGPAFQAGRYGVACAEICAALKDAGLAAVTGLHVENPGVDVERQKVFAVPVAGSAAGMREAMDAMVRLGMKLVSGEGLTTPEEDGYIPLGIRKNVFAERNAAQRAVELLVKKIRGESFGTEIPLPQYDRVPPSQLASTLGDTTIAIVTESGLVPMGNPDHLESARSRRWLTYPIAGLDALPAGEYQTIHGGFDNAPISADPHRAVPLDVLRELEAEGAFGRLHDRYYVTTGMTMAIADAERIGREIAADLLENEIRAAVLTST